MLGWTKQFNIFCFLDNADYSIQPHYHDCLLAAGATASITSGDLKLLDQFLDQQRGWKFGHLSYELKNSIYHFENSKADPIGFPPFFFFAPRHLLQLRDDVLTIHSIEPHVVYEQILAQCLTTSVPVPVSISQQLSRDQYLEKIEQLKKHIVRGDCYEINFCQEFFVKEMDIDPCEAFGRLRAVSPNPFAAFYRMDERYLLCASPERFICKKGKRIFSQPMKGTIKRNLADNREDARLKEELRASSKDQSENVMVVDLVRNDLSRICRDGTVKVDELFGVYSYPQVHQMISTISGELKDTTSFSEIVEATFPMGSMTGAPKYRVMQLIDQYETASRGIFSGSVGYIDDKGDFDFNVVIRSIMYNADSKYLSYQVGSGITFYSDPEKEWEECLLKGEAIKKVLTLDPALL